VPRREPLCWNDSAAIPFREQSMKFRNHKNFRISKSHETRVNKGT
jgi:hypothetical protein